MRTIQKLNNQLLINKKNSQQKDYKKQKRIFLAEETQGEYHVRTPSDGKKRIETQTPVLEKYFNNKRYSLCFP